MCKIIIDFCFKSSFDYDALPSVLKFDEVRADLPERNVYLKSL